MIGGKVKLMIFICLIKINLQTNISVDELFKDTTKSFN